MRSCIAGSRRAGFLRIGQLHLLPAVLVQQQRGALFEYQMIVRVDDITDFQDMFLPLRVDDFNRSLKSADLPG
ncbi:hypothetical protein BI343_11240 [Chromobacterium amazonense]|nr:hypothetical protein BI343_11240 [Chromobacterium amazonense]